MRSDVLQKNLQIASALLRVSMGTLFFLAAAGKVPGGIAGTVGYYTSLFQNTFLPSFLVTAHASVIMFVEFALALWLFTGFKLRWGWIASGLVLVSLAAGMLIAGKTDVAGANFLYVFYAAVGVVLSGFDRWTLGSNND